MNRRSMLRGMIHTGVAWNFAGVACRSQESRAVLSDPAPAKLPRWRGFNLLEMFHAGGDRPFREEDFAWIAEARLQLRPPAAGLSMLDRLQRLDEAPRGSTEAAGPGGGAGPQARDSRPA